MKKHFFSWAFIALTATTILCGCGNSSDVNKIDYLPCKAEKGQDWGFVDNKGNVYLADEYKHTPTDVKEGVFFVEEEGAINMYAFDKKKPKLLLEGLEEAGEPKNGLVPVVKPDSRIEIVDLKGKTVLELNSFDGNEVIACGIKFNEYGWLEVYTVDSEGKRHKLLIDKKGKVVFTPDAHFDAEGWAMIRKDLIIGLTAAGDGEAADMVAFNRKNEIQEKWGFLLGNGVEIQYDDDKYVAIERDDRTFIYSMKDGEQVMKCPEKVASIQSIKGKQIVFRSNSSYSYGVMNFDGETILSAKYSYIKILDKGYLVNKDGEKYEVLNKKGEKESKLDWDGMYETEGFGWIGKDGKDYYILNDKFEAVHKTELYYITDNSVEDETLSSYYFDTNAAVGKTISALKSDLQNAGFVLGNTASNIPAIKGLWIENINRYQTSYNQVIAAGNGYSLTATIHFDDRLKKNDELNGAAAIDGMSITLSFPSKNKEDVKKQVADAMANSFAKEDDKTYTTNEYTYKVAMYYSNIEIVIIHKEPANEDEALLNEIMDAVVDIANEIE